MNPRGRQVLVTGGSSGVGRALCAQLLRQGCDVLACGRDRDRLAATAASLPGLRTVVADLATPAGRTAVIARVHHDLPELSLLINNAAVQILAGWFNRDPAEIIAEADQEIAINLTAPLHLAASLLPLLARGDEAVLVNVTSGLAIVPKRSAPVYCATKAALRAFSTALRYQARVDAPSVRVLEAVLPLVDTPMTAGRGAAKLSPEQAAAAILRGVSGNRDVVYVGAVKPLQLIHRIAPAVSARLLRDS